MEERRRQQDKRLDALERKVEDAHRKIDAATSEADVSPAGRSILRRLERIETRLDPIYDWWQQTRGAWRFILGLSTVLGIIGTAFGVAAYFGIVHR